LLAALGVCLGFCPTYSVSSVSVEQTEADPLPKLDGAKLSRISGNKTLRGIRGILGE